MSNAEHQDKKASLSKIGSGSKSNTSINSSANSNSNSNTESYVESQQAAKLNRYAQSNLTNAILTPKQVELGGLAVKRCLPSKQCRSIGPWVFFDHMGPTEFQPGQGVDIAPHPHIGLATVTYLFKGELLHRDSLHSNLPINPGDINLMIAGKGVVHSERQRDTIKSKQQYFEGLQLWLALPAEFEQMEPEFHHYNQSKIPQTVINGVTIKVLMGEAYGLKSPVKTLSTTTFLELDVRANQAFYLPDMKECGLYVVKGRVSIETVKIETSQLVLFKSNLNSNLSQTKVEANEHTLLAIIGGDPVGERFIEWNFVASQKNLIDQAKQRWQQGLFEKIPGDDKEFMPLPTKD